LQEEASRKEAKEGKISGGDGIRRLHVRLAEPTGSELGMSRKTKEKSKKGKGNRGRKREPE